MTGESETPKPLPPDDPAFRLEDSPFYNINRTSATYVEEMAHILQSVGMEQSGWRVLMLLKENNQMTVSEISRKSFIKLSTITRILIRMEEEGLVHRQLSEADNRVTEVYATDKGRENLKKLSSIAGRVYRRAFEGIPEKDAVHLVRTLKLIHKNLTRSHYLD